MRAIIKMVLLKSQHLQKVLTRSAAWLIRERYSRVEMSKFYQLIGLLSINKSHGVTLRRYGSRHDGGYVLADLGMRYSKLISFGVGDNIEFETSLSNFIDEIELFDHTVDRLPTNFNNAIFHRVGLSDKSTGDFVDLESVTPTTSVNNILKIDIEGDEWKSLLNVSSDLLNSYAQIVVELHDLHNIDYQKTLEDYLVVLNLLHKNHDLVFVHGNNWSQVQVIHGFLFPDALEVTFLRRDLILPGEQRQNHLESLHSPNNPEFADLKLSF